MKKYTQHIALAHHIIASNVWLLTDDQGRRFIVDTGPRAEKFTLRRQLHRAGLRRPGDITAVLLTHRHSDHADNAAWLRSTFGCPVCCHPNDAEILNGLKDPDPLRRGLGNALDEFLCGVEDARPSRCPVDETFTEGPWKWGFRIIPAFGHTEGSCMLYHEPTETLFSGDVLLAGIPPFRIWEKLGLAKHMYSIDVEQAHRRTLDFLADAPPVRYLCSGHGPFIGNNTARKLERFYGRMGL